jgi:putative flippase GtrA
LINRIRSVIYKIWSVQLLRFFIVGGLNTIFGYLVFAFFIYFNLHYVLATLLAQICGVLFNFKTTGFWVFKNRDNRLILRFFGVYLFTYLLNIGILKLFEMNNVTSLIGEAIIIIPLAMISFYLNKKLVFRDLSKEPSTIPHS